MHSDAESSQHPDAPAGGDATRLPRDQQIRGMRYTYIGQAMGALLPNAMCNSAFGVLLIKAVGGTDLQAMLLASLLGLTRVAQVPVSLLVHPERGKRLMIRAWAIEALLHLLVAAVPLVMGLGANAAWMMLAISAVGRTVGICGATFWYPLLHDIVPPDRRGRYFGIMRGSWNASILVAVILIGLFLGAAPALWQYQLVLVVLVASSFGRVYFVSRVPENPHSHAAGADYGNWRRHLSALFGRRDVVTFLVYFVLISVLIGLLRQPLVLYMEYRGFPVRDNILVFSASRAGMVVAFLLGGAITDHLGTRRTLVGTNLITALVCFAVVLIGTGSTATAKIWLPAALVVAGALYGSATVAAPAQLLHFAPLSGRTFFLSVGLLMITAGHSLSPLLAGFILEFTPAGWTLTIAGESFDIYQVMIGAAGVALLACLPLSRGIRDFRAADAR